MKTAGVTFLERITRYEIGADGTRTQKSEIVTIPMVYNNQMIKIRKQCSSCQEYMTPKGSGGSTYIYCPRCKNLSGETPNGRHLCKMWKMSDTYSSIGRNPIGKVKSSRYMSWLTKNLSQLINDHMLLPMSCKPYFMDYVHEKFKDLTGLDEYGLRVNHD